MDERMEIYEAAREVPGTAKRMITGGRLKGKTDINPMWRIKKLTELFGPCGIGWKYEIVRMWTETGNDGEATANVNINLFYRKEDGWSEAIPGVGGSMLVAKEKGGMFTSDECYKMALTDAISVSCKALGIGADVYWSGDVTKYTDQREETVGLPGRAGNHAPVCGQCGKEVEGMAGHSAGWMEAYTRQKYGMPLCAACAMETGKTREAEDEEQAGAAMPAGVSV